MGANPAVGQVEDYREDEQADQQYRDPSQPTLHQPEAAPKEVAQKDHRRCPDGPSQGVVEEEGSPAHPAYASDQGTEHAQAGEEASHENGLPTVPGEERFGTSETLGGDKEVASPPEDEGAATFAADPVADLVSHHSAEDAEEDHVSKIQTGPLNQDAGGEEYGLTGQWNPSALQHHPKEDDQVTVVFDERGSGP